MIIQVKLPTPSFKRQIAFRIYLADVVLNGICVKV